MNTKAATDLCPFDFADIVKRSRYVKKQYELLDNHKFPLLPNVPAYSPDPHHTSTEEFKAPAQLDDWKKEASFKEESLLQLERLGKVEVPECLDAKNSVVTPVMVVVGSDKEPAATEEWESPAKHMETSNEQEESPGQEADSPMLTLKEENRQLTLAVHELSQLLEQALNELNDLRQRKNG